MEQKSGGTDIIEVIEAVQNDFCKWILGLNRKATNIMAREECGRLPLTFYMIKPVNNWYIKCKNGNSKISKTVFGDALQFVILVWFCVAVVQLKTGYLN